jgi:hypothetical protein
VDLDKYSLRAVMHKDAFLIPLITVDRVCCPLHICKAAVYVEKLRGISIRFSQKKFVKNVND